MLRVRGQAGVFNHRDTNRLVKVAEPEPNPLTRIMAMKQGEKA